MGKLQSWGTIRRRASVAAAAVACVLTAAPVATAADSGKGSILSTYGGKSTPLVTITKPKPGGLPNTGLDVAFVIAGGAAIGALGFGLRRLARQKR